MNSIASSNVQYGGGYSQGKPVSTKTARKLPEHSQGDKVSISRKAAELERTYAQKEASLEKTFAAESSALEREYLQNKRTLEMEFQREKQSLGTIDMYV